MLKQKSYLSICQFNATAAAAAPKTSTNKIIPIKDITKPAIANPFGFLKTPTKDRIRPKTHMIHPNTGTQPKNNAIRDSTKPAVPTPFFSSLLD